VRIATAAALLALLLALLLACSPLPGSVAGRAPDAYQPQPPQHRGGSLTIADFEYPGTLDPLAARTDTELRLSGLVFAPLWTFDDRLRPYPDLVREVPTPENGEVRTASGGRSMSVDVKLVQGLRWSDGPPLTADDVLFSLRAMKDPATGAVAPGGLDRLTGARRVSDTELTLTFEGVYAPYLELGAALFVLPAHRLASVPTAQWAEAAFFQRPDVASGPFVVSQASAGTTILFDANPEYFAGEQTHRRRPALDHLAYTVLSGKAAVIAALRKGDADLAFHLDPDDLPALTGMPSSSSRTYEGLRDESLAPNHAANSASGVAPPWLNDRRVLDALDLALDRSELVRQAQDGAGQPARGVFPRALSAFVQGTLLSSLPKLDAARRTLDRAGWTLGGDGVRVKDGRRLEFSLLTPCESHLAHATAQVLVAEWQEVGAAVAATCRPRDAFLKAASTAAFDMLLASNGWGPDPGSPSALAAETGGQNTGSCHDEQLEAAMRRGADTLDPAGRRTAYAQAEKEWLAYHCTIPLFEVASVSQVPVRLHNFAPSPALGLETWNAADWWIS
jgi:peptide/nickel transport system substrate-binding protein